LFSFHYHRSLPTANLAQAGTGLEKGERPWRNAVPARDTDFFTALVCSRDTAIATALETLPRPLAEAALHNLLFGAAQLVLRAPGDWRIQNGIDRPYDTLDAVLSADRLLISEDWRVPSYVGVT
jgi:hypothetical protein